MLVVAMMVTLLVSMVTRGVIAQEFGDIQQLLGFALGNQVNTMMSSCCIIRELRCPVRRRMTSHLNASSEIARELQRFSQCVCRRHMQCVLVFPPSFLPNDASGLDYDVTFITRSRTSQYACDYRGNRALVCRHRQSVSNSMMRWMVPGFASGTANGSGGAARAAGGGDGGLSGFHGLAALGSAGLLGEEMEETMEQLIESGISPSQLMQPSRRPATASRPCRRCTPLRCGLKVAGLAERDRRLESVDRLRSRSLSRSSSLASSSAAPASTWLGVDRQRFHQCLRENSVQPPRMPTTPTPPSPPQTTLYPLILPLRLPHDRVYTSLPPPLDPRTPKPTATVTTTRRTTPTTTTTRKTTITTTATTTATTSSATSWRTVPTSAAATTTTRRTSTTKRPASVTTPKPSSRPTTPEKQTTKVAPSASTRTTPTTTTVTTAAPATTATAVTTTTPQVITRILVGSGSETTSTPTQKNAFGDVTETGGGNTSMGGGGLAGVIIGLGVALLVVVVCFVLVFRRQRQRRDQRKLGDSVHPAATGRHSTGGGLGGKLHYKARPLPSVSSKQAVIDAVDADDDFEKPDDDYDDDSNDFTATTTNNDSNDSVVSNSGDRGAQRYTTPPTARKPSLSSAASKIGDDTESLYATLDETAITSTQNALGGVTNNNHVTSTGAGPPNKSAASLSKKVSGDSMYVKMDGLASSGQTRGGSADTGSNKNAPARGKSSNGKYYYIKTPAIHDIANIAPEQALRSGVGDSSYEEVVLPSQDSSRHNNNNTNYINTPSASSSASVRGHYEKPRPRNDAEGQQGNLYTPLKRSAAINQSRKEGKTSPSSPETDRPEAEASSTYHHNYYSEPEYLYPCATPQVSRTNSTSTTMIGNDVYSEPYSTSVRRKYGGQPQVTEGGERERGENSRREVNRSHDDSNDNSKSVGGSDNNNYYSSNGISGSGFGRSAVRARRRAGGGGGPPVAGKECASSASKSCGPSGKAGGGTGDDPNRIRGNWPPQSSNPAPPRNASNATTAATTSPTTTTTATTAAVTVTASNNNNSGSVRTPKVDSDGYLVPVTAKPRRL